MASRQIAGMSAVCGRSVGFKLGAVALILFSVLVGILRPLVRIQGHSHNRWELSRMVFLAEPVADPQSPPISPVRVTVQFLAPVLMLLMVLKARRLARSPVPVRRLKLPTRATADSLLTD